MKNKLKINRKLVSTFGILLFSIGLFAQQNDSIKGNWNVKFGLSHSSITAIRDARVARSTVTPFSLDVNYGLTKRIEIGAYGGFTLCDNPFIDNELNYFTGKGNYHPGFVYSAGVKLNYHLLEKYCEGKSNFDLYLTGSYGLAYYQSRTDGINSFLKPEASLGIGAGYQINKHWGVYAEGKIGNLYSNPSHAKFGFSFKL